MIIREILVEPQAIAWLPWAVSYFFFIGLSLTAILLGFIIYHLEKNTQHEFIAISIALTTALVAPIALTADLHQPSRIMNFYLHLTPWSWMAWGAIFLPLFTVSVVGYFLCLLRQVIPQQNLPKIFKYLYMGNLNIPAWTKFFRWFSLIFAGAILVYTTMEMFNVAARPLWHQYWLMALIFFSAFPTVTVLYRLFVEILMQEKMSKVLSSNGLVSVLLFLCSVCGLYYFSTQTTDQLIMLWHFSSLLMWVLVCAFVLIILHFLPHSIWMNILMALVALAFTWLVRWILIIQVQSIPKYSALMNPYHLSWQVDGMIGILSVWSLWIFIGLVFWQLFRISFVSVNTNGGQYE